jgi:hypothetical protein
MMVQVIIFAGGLSEAGAQLLDAVKRAYEAHGWTILENKVRLAMIRVMKDGCGGCSCLRA